MWINRIISDRIMTSVAQRPVVVISGARQVGKTSLIKKLFPTYGFVSLDLPALASQAETESEDFLRTHPAPMVIDEVQYAPKLFRYLKIQVDSRRSEYGQFILTGSQKFLLMKGISDSLAGRVGVLELETLTYDEIDEAFPDTNIHTLLLRGAYPELWQNRTLDAREFYGSYLATYLERDVRSLLAVESLRDFERFIRACALRSAQLLNKSDLARDVGVRPSTAGQWISVLEASNQVFLLEPWFSNRTKSLVKTPKLYWHDAGFMAYLLGIRNEEELLNSPFRGAVWETFVYSEFRKKLMCRSDTGRLFFWRDRGVEVDFLIDRGGTFDLYDAKCASDLTERDAESLLKVRSILGEEHVRSLNLISRSRVPYRLGSQVKVVPGTKIF